MPTYLEDADEANFDPATYVASRMPGYATMSPEQKSSARRAATKDDPLLFGILYCQKDLTDEQGNMSFASMHIDLCKIARHYRKPIDPDNPLAFAFIAPRNAGKSTWVFKIIMMWAAAHGHKKFVLYLTASGPQAERWVKNFKRVLDANKLLREDFPRLCVPAKRESTGRAFNDDNQMFAAENGFTLAAMGIDNENLGLNVDATRPDMIIFDDIESHGGKYTMYQMNQRLMAVEQSIPMGQPGCALIFVGTVNMPGSIMDQLRLAPQQEKPEQWIGVHKIRTRHYKPFVDMPNGERRSFWVGKWSTARMQEMEGTRYFATVFANDPIPEDGDYWREGDILKSTIHREVPCLTVLSIDPAVKSKKKSDFTALSIVRYAPSLDKYEILYGRAFKLNPGLEMPQYVAELLGTWNEVTALIVEDNQGGDLWQAFYGNIPGVRLWQVNNHGMSKTQRAAHVLRMYQMGQVFHSTNGDTSQLEQEMYGFPNNLHDDLPDSVCTAVLTIQNKFKRAASDSEASYV